MIWRVGDGGWGSMAASHFQDLLLWSDVQIGSYQKVTEQEQQSQIHRLL